MHNESIPPSEPQQLQGKKSDVSAAQQTPEGVYCSYLEIFFT